MSAFEAAGLSRVPAWMAHLLRAQPDHHWWALVRLAATVQAGEPIRLAVAHWAAADYGSAGGERLMLLAAFFPGRRISLTCAADARVACGFVPA